jgi:hypothetical protein
MQFPHIPFVHYALVIHFNNRPENFRRLKNFSVYEPHLESQFAGSGTSDFGVRL